MDDQPKPAATPAIDVSTIMARWARRDALEAELVPVNKACLIGALAEAGIQTVTIRFDGCGDSGQIEEIEALDADGLVVEIPPATVDLQDIAWEAETATTAQLSLPDALETLVYRLLGSTHPGWENNDGAYGEFVFDVAAGTITLSHSDRITVTEDHHHLF